MKLLEDDDFKTLIRCGFLNSIDLIVKTSHDEILLGLRKNRPAKDFWFVPGMQWRPNDEENPKVEFEIALKSTIKEELKVNFDPKIKTQISNVHIIGNYKHSYNDNFYDDLPNVKTHYMVIACLVDVHERLTNLPSEQHQAYQWVNAKTLLQMPDVHENTKAYFQVAPKQLIFGNTLSYLMEGGLPEEEEEIAVKRNLALQIKEMMGSQNLSIFEMARRMHTSRATLERLLDPENRSVTLNTMDKAARSLGKRLQLVLS